MCSPCAHKCRKRRTNRSVICCANCRLMTGASYAASGRMSSVNVSSSTIWFIGQLWMQQYSTAQHKWCAMDVRTEFVRVQRTAMREEELEVRQQRDRQIDRRRYRLKAPQFEAHITVLYSVLYCRVVDRTYEYEYEYTRKPVSDGPSHRHTRRKSGVGVSRATESVSELPSLRNTWTDGGRRLQIWRVAVCWSPRWEHKQRVRTSSTYNMYDIWNIKSPKYTVLKEWASKSKAIQPESIFMQITSFE